MSELFPDESSLLTLNDPCLIEDCLEVGAKVIIKTKINTVEGEISVLNSKQQIKVKYNALDAGYTSGYQLDNCEIESIRCYVCCDDRYYEIDNCDDFSDEALETLFGNNTPDGKIFVYSGDLNEPNCLWRYTGLGNITSVDNWIDEYGHLAAQFDNMPEAQIVQFVNWLSSKFDGNGVSFNANLDDGTIVVTVVGDGYVGATSFTINYEDGYIHYNPGDGSGVKTAMLIEKGDGPPSEPYNWFMYINELTNTLYLNSNGEALLMGTLQDGDLDTCTGIINCLKYNLDNPPAKDRYALPELSEAPWIISEVVYGEEPTSIADYSDCSGSDIDDLIINLNNCVSNPANWTWVNNGGIVTLCVPVGTNILTISYGDPVSVVNFAGVPTTPGDDYPDLCAEVADCLVERDLLKEYITETAVKFSSSTTEEDIEAEFGAYLQVQVSWKDSDDDPRISYKYQDGTWYHPVIKTLTNPINLYDFSILVATTDLGNVLNEQELDLDALGIPADVKELTVRMVAQSYGIGGANYANMYLHAGEIDGDWMAGVSSSRAATSGGADYLNLVEGTENPQPVTVNIVRNELGIFKVRSRATYDVSVGGSPSIQYRGKIDVLGYRK